MPGTPINKGWDATLTSSRAKILGYLILSGIGLMLAACSLEKESGFNRSMQNLTAHYNILYNANLALQQKQDAYALAFVDNYNDILKVYQDTIPKSNTPDKDLDSVIIRANNIINNKEQSHYLGDAYLLLGKANYLGGNYYSAIEYFSYDIRSFANQLKLVQEARVWKARALLQLGKITPAGLLIDTAIGSINPKKKQGIGQIYATQLQYLIDTANYKAAEDVAQKAIAFADTRKQRLRLTFILAQLQELNQKPAEAYQIYSRIVNSNASFEMAFNASLNRIRISENQGNDNKGRLAQLQELLKNQNNKDFADQVYFQIGELYLAKNDIDNALKYYRLSVNSSTKNQVQKGLSYLRIADINFKNKANYLQAKKNYDSTLATLPPGYPGYLQLQKKANNLQILADRFQIISREDTLQMLAGLDDAARKAHIDAMVNAFILKQQSVAVTSPAPNNFDNGASTSIAASGGKSTFYFYNSQAVSQGLNDFRRRWGDRKLTDNWRRTTPVSQLASNANPVNNNFASQQLDPDSPIVDRPQKGPQDVSAEAYRRQIMDGLPLSPLRMQQSNLRIFNAYMDIAGFYRDIMNDRNEAIATYLLILKRFPDNNDRPAIFYNLYRLYTDAGNQKEADNYKDILLRAFPETPFAKIIADPEYATKLDNKDAEFDGLYNKVYDLYANRKYKDVITQADALLQQYPSNKRSAQLAYLKAMAAGHDEKLAPFQADLQNIVAKYPDDHLIGPLVNQHLNYITANQAEMASRPVVLTDDTVAENPLVVPPVKPGYVRQVIKIETIKLKPGQHIPTDVNKSESVKASPATPASIFSLRDSTDMYFVVNVASGTTNLASSRFGIGQFNRANFQQNTITHQLLPVGDDNQLIYVGRFNSLGAVKDYARAIVPLLPDIMKAPKDKYSFFIITKENLNKLADKKTLDSYLDYYQKNYFK